MSLLDGISTGTNFLSAGSSALGLVDSTKALLKKNIKGIQGFLFDIPQNEELTLTAQITDHFVESNWTAQDHIAIEPIRVRLTGMLGELVYSKDAGESYVSEALDRLGPLGVLGAAGSSKTREYLSQYNRTKQAVINAIKVAEKLGVPGLDSLTGVTSDGRQQAGYQTLKKWFGDRSLLDPATGSNKRELLTIETPWDTFSNMAIESMVFSQDESTKDYSTVEITLKEIRFTTVVLATGILDKRKMGGPVVTKVSNGTPQDTTSGLRQAATGVP